ncbi:hypothetical protein Taro_008255 [Colocasia esculenta]|uniref:Jasmonic acid-amido synthetase JAR1 n=1 Tax=Colocasia esculenta TaxID=4460 RepID=A0A843TWL1_COLES|nr:hypothetical protein [Colocasia esculenta]
MANISQKGTDLQMSIRSGRSPGSTIKRKRASPKFLRPRAPPWSSLSFLSLSLSPRYCSSCAREGAAPVALKSAPLPSSHEVPLCGHLQVDPELLPAESPPNSSCRRRRAGLLLFLAFVRGRFLQASAPPLLLIGSPSLLCSWAVGAGGPAEAALGSARSPPSSVCAPQTGLGLLFVVVPLPPLSLLLRCFCCGMRRYLFPIILSGVFIDMLLEINMGVNFPGLLFAKMRVFSEDSVIEEFEMLTKDVRSVQVETLRRILEENREAEYLQGLGLRGRTDPESFKACVPLVTHADLEGYIKRIADGESSPILTGKPITSISLSSGTTQGKPKYVPFNSFLVQDTMQIYKTSFAFRNKEFPIGNGKGLQFIYSSKQVLTAGGLIATTATTNVYRSESFKRTMKDIQSQSSSPDEVIFGRDFEQSLYCHLLCGLLSSNEVQFVSSTFAHSIVHAFRTFEQVWEELCADIREGVLSSKITDPSMRDAVSKLLYPNPELADSISNKCNGLSNWFGVIPELWPNAKYVYGIMTGSMEPYLKKLRHYSGSLPLLSADYGSSEGWIGANVNPKLPPEEARFAVLPDIGYFEFIPLMKEGEEQDSGSNVANSQYTELEPVGLADVVLGKEYEIIVTNFAGLYRYRLGDVLRVTGFHNTTPELQFVCRRSLVLTLNIDKNTERDLQLAVEEASKLVAAEKLEVLDFSSCLERSTEPGRYVVFWELTGEARDDVLQGCADCLDRAFVDAGYVGSRRVKAIAPLELRVVRKGTFRKVLEHYLNQGAAMSQFKTPRFVGAANVNLLQIFCGNVVGSYFSTAYD